MKVIKPELEFLWKEVKLIIDKAPLCGSWLREAQTEERQAN